MKWLTGKPARQGVRMRYPDDPSVGVRVYLQHLETQRVVLLLNPAFVKKAMLRPGDRLLIGIEGDKIGLVRSKDGNAIVGGEFSDERTKGKSKHSRATPYVSFNGRVFPEILEWAKTRKHRWISMRENGVNVDRCPVWETVSG